MCAGRLGRIGETADAVRDVRKPRPFA